MAVRHRIAVVGSGPAALMIADVLSGRGICVRLFEKRKGIGRKLLVAGSSGLNITNTLPLNEFASHYKHSGDPAHFDRAIEAFPPCSWISHIESLGFKTFEGSSGRCLIEDKKAASFVKAWKERLLSQGVEFVLGSECTGITKATTSQPLTLHFNDGKKESFDHACFALGGASWEPEEEPLRWPKIFEAHGIRMDPFAPSNVGYEVSWKKEFLKESEGKPLKNVLLRTSKGERVGEIMITNYGIEGTPVYFVGRSGEASLDLLPGQTIDGIAAKLLNARENLSPIRRITKLLSLSPASLALVFHHSNPGIMESRDYTRIAKHLKRFPLTLLGPRPLQEAISSSGGIAFSEIDDSLMLKKIPGCFVAGEMLSWDVPTGGFLIQGAVSQGHWVASQILGTLKNH